MEKKTFDVCAVVFSAAAVLIESVHGKCLLKTTMNRKLSVLTAWLNIKAAPILFFFAFKNLF